MLNFNSPETIKKIKELIQALSLDYKVIGISSFDVTQNFNSNVQPFFKIGNTTPQIIHGQTTTELDLRIKVIVEPQKYFVNYIKEAIEIQKESNHGSS